MRLIFFLLLALLRSFYIVGNAEGSKNGHVTALTVAPEYRRLGIARKLTALLEFVSDTVYHALFVDLFVRCKNELAIEMYEGMGYSVWRRIREYYGSLGLGNRGRDEEDAFGEHLSVFPLSINKYPRYAKTPQSRLCSTIGET